MKIIQLLHNTGPHIGGVEQCAINYSKALISGNNYICTIIPDKNVSYKDSLVGDIKEVSIRNKILLFFQLIKIVISIKPDFIIMHSSRGLIILNVLKLFLEFKIIGVNHGFNINKYTKNCDIIFCINNAQVKKLRDSSGNKLKIVYFPNITDIKDNIEFREINPTNTIKIGILSRIDFEYKNLDKVVFAAKIMKERNINFRFYIGGDFGEIEKLKKLIKDNNVEDKFLLKGLITNKENFFREIDIFCMPSKNETFGISYIEAMANGIAVIATNNDGANDIIDHNIDGILIEKDNPDIIPKLIVEAINFLVLNPANTMKIQEAAFSKVRNEFSLNAMINRFNNLADSIFC